MKDSNQDKKKKKEEKSCKVEIDFEPTLQEVLSISARLKKKAQMRRFKFKMKNARKRSLKRKADNLRIHRRARRAAVNQMKKKLAGGQDVRKLSYSARARIEKLAKRRMGAINRNTRRQILVKRALDRNRHR